MLANRQEAMMQLINDLWGKIFIHKESIHLISSITVIVGILYVWILWLFKPRLRIYFDKDKTFDEVPDGVRNVEVKWVHAVVKNLGLRRAESCNGYVLKILKKINDDFQLLPGFKSEVYIHQHWANEPKGYDPQAIEGQRERRLIQTC